MMNFTTSGMASSQSRHKFVFFVSVFYLFTMTPEQIIAYTKVVIALANDRHERDISFAETLEPGGFVPGMNEPEEHEPVTVFVKSNISV